MTASWLSRRLKNRKNGSGSEHKSKSDGPLQGINDFSELAAVLDFYEVRKRTDGMRCSTFVLQKLCTLAVAVELVVTASYLRLSALTRKVPSKRSSCFVSVPPRSRVRCPRTAS